MDRNEDRLETARPAAPQDAAGRAMLGVARVAFGVFFLGSAVLKLLATPTMVGMLEGAGFRHPMLWVWFAATAQAAGGLALLSNRLVRWASLALVAYVGIVNFYLHGFWRLSGEAASIQFQLFSKNLGIVAGLLAVAAGAGTWGLSRREARHA